MSEERLKVKGKTATTRNLERLLHYFNNKALPWYRIDDGDREVIRDAIRDLSALEQQAGEWVSVKDRLPEEGQRVLITVRQLRIDFATHISGRFYQPYTPYGVTFDDVTYWQPLPAAPSIERDR